MRLSRLVATAVVLVVSASTLSAQGAVAAAPSGRGITEVSLTPINASPGGNAQAVRIRVDYGQPHLRGRQLHSGNLVPYDQPWRLGANEATTLTTDVDLTLGNANIAKGSYVLFALPSRSGWKLIVQKHPSGSGMAEAMAYSEANDVARVDLRQTTLQSPVESLSIWLIPSTEEGPAKGELRISWGTTQLSANWATK